MHFENFAFEQLAQDIWDLRGSKSTSGANQLFPAQAWPEPAWLGPGPGPDQPDFDPTRLGLYVPTSLDAEGRLDGVRGCACPWKNGAHLLGAC